MVIGYLMTKSQLSSNSRISLVSTLRQFLRYMFQYDEKTYIPERSLVPVKSNGFIPHIYSKKEVLAIIDGAKKLSNPSSLRPHTYVTIIGLLWVTGLRIGEIVRLNDEDVDLKERILYIKKTK